MVTCVVLTTAAAALAIFGSLVEVAGHGMLWDPVNRGSMWRFGYDTPINYNDNELFCGGKWVQWDENEGRCGLCGDNFALDRPRPNENTGLFGTGVPVNEYWRGQTINATIKITANHMGFVIFNLCPLTNKTELETEECFNTYPLKVGGGSNYKYYLPSTESRLFYVAVKLPESISCELCVLQWTYIVGEYWRLVAHVKNSLH
uniref:Chitin-binding type-4 domain-containing protein n=1 Tax=Timema shepardi TaxID=629360 RepID=A0A7R9AR60_TIMSH|nr:unnamed protein product [Timema shepardi]